MMRWAFVADVHIGNHNVMGGGAALRMNRRCMLTLDVFSMALDVAIKNDCGAFVVCGDLFDRSDPAPQLVAAVQERLETALLKARNGMNIILLAGNHDQWSGAPGDHALAPLRISPRIEVVDQPRCIHGAHFVPFVPGECSEETISRALKDSKPQLLVMHAGIATERTPPWLVGAQDSITRDALFDLMNERCVTFAFAGNWHKAETFKDRRTERAAVQCGALCPTGFDNPSAEGEFHPSGADPYGHVWVYDSAYHVAQSRVVRGPRFLTRDYGSPWADEAAGLTGHRYTPFVRVRALPKDAAAAIAELKQAEDDGAIFAGEVQVVTPQSVEGRRDASRTADRGGATIEQSASAYIDKLDLGNVDKESVRRRVHAYIASQRQSE